VTVGNTDEQPRKATGRFERSIKTAQRDAKAALMRTHSKTYKQIADALGISTTEAYRAVGRALKSAVQEPGELVLKMEMEKLDRMEQRALSVINRRTKQLRGSTSKGYAEDGILLQANAQLLRIHESRRRLLGLDAPIKTEVTAGVQYEIIGINTDDLK
jgi:hypothetical protein